MPALSKEQRERTEKACSKCRIVKQRGEFSVAKANSDGMAGWCKACMKELRDAKRAKSLESKPKRVPRSAEYWREWHKGWRSRNREKCRGYCREWSATFPGRFKLLGGHARRRGLAVEFTVEQYTEIVRGMICDYCGGKLPKKGHGIDRKDSALGYSIENCVPCCARCNKIKCDLVTYEEMLQIAPILRASRERREAASG